MTKFQRELIDKQEITCERLEKKLSKEKTVLLQNEDVRGSVQVQRGGQ